MSRVGVPLGIAVANTPLGKMKLPMRLASKMWALVNDRRALKVSVCARDGPWVHTYTSLGRGLVDSASRTDSEQSINLQKHTHTHITQAFLSDGSSAGNWVPARFLATYMTHAPAIEPEAFTACPILLTQPAQDRWTPLALRCVCVLLLWFHAWLGFW